MLGLGCSAGFSLVAGSWGCSLAAVSGLLTELASPVAGRGLEGTLVVHGLSGGGSRALELRLSVWAEMLCSTWDLPRTRIEPMSP